MILEVIAWKIHNNNNKTPTTQTPQFRGWIAIYFRAGLSYAANIV